jgi:hypothetical protein
LPQALERLLDAGILVALQRSATAPAPSSVLQVDRRTWKWPVNVVLVVVEGGGARLFLVALHG